MIETKRLQIIPLLYDQLLMYVKADPSLEKELNVQPFIHSFSKDLLQIIEHIIIPKLLHPENDYHYFSIWLIILKTKRIVVGDLFFKGEPDDKGEIEIGYGTYEAQRTKGYMSEAIAGMIEWARKQQPVNAILAETEKMNTGSIKVLQNNHFQVYREKGNAVWMRLGLKKIPV
jgi:GNAT superfamily N-acetyltransferase